MRCMNTFLLLIFILVTPLCKAGELPANTWTKAPESEAFKKLSEFSLMISDKRRPKSSNWLFIDKWFEISGYNKRK